MLVEDEATMHNLRKLPQFSGYSEVLTKAESNSFYHKTRYKVLVRITDVSQLDINYFTNPMVTWDGKKIVVEEDGVRHEYIDLSVALHYLKNEFQIYVENKTSDGAFLKEVYQLVTGEKLSSDLIHTCGGDGEAKKIIESMEKPIRAICIIDSDIEFPGH